MIRHLAEKPLAIGPPRYMLECGETDNYIECSQIGQASGLGQVALEKSARPLRGRFQERYGEIDACVVKWTNSPGQKSGKSAVPTADIQNMTRSTQIRQQALVTRGETLPGSRKWFRQTLVKGGV